MARKSKSTRVNEALLLNPLLRRDDPRLTDLFMVEDLLRKAQKAAKDAPVTVIGGTGSPKRSPEWVAVDRAQDAVRRLKTELQLDRTSTKRLETAGVKRKRTDAAIRLIDQYGPDYLTHRALLPNLAAFLSAQGIEAGDLPEEHREAYESDLAAQAEHVAALAERIKLAKQARY